MCSRLALGVLFCASMLPAQKYDGPRPPKADVPYLLHANELVATEAGQAKEQNRKDEITYVIEGANSSAKTPLASPIFLLEAEQLAPDKIELYRLEARNGQRQVMFSRKKKDNNRPLRLSVAKVADRLYRLEVEESLENGEYSLTPSGSNQVYCFQVY